MRKSITILALALLSAAARDARADGAVIATAKLPTAARTSLVADIAKARKATPEAFVALDKVAAQLADLDAKKRGRMAPVTPILKRLGAKALLPMLERAAIQSNARGDLNDTAWKTWRVSLVEATGMLRDQRSMPLFTAVLQGDDLDYDLLKVTAESMGRLGDDSAAQQLITLAKQAGPRQKPVLAGMGECRRLSVAQTLAEASRNSFGALDEETARLVAKSLGQVGSAWAWKLASEHQDEQAATRALAAKALVDLFVARNDESRSSATAGLLMVDDPSTPQLIAQARNGASPELAAALDNLAARFAKNPLR